MVKAQWKILCKEEGWGIYMLNILIVLLFNSLNSYFGYDFQLMLPCYTKFVTWTNKQFGKYLKIYTYEVPKKNPIKLIAFKYLRHWNFKKCLTKFFGLNFLSIKFYTSNSFDIRISNCQIKFEFSLKIK